MTEKGHAKHLRVYEYIIPFAKQLPPEGFKTTWVDWDKTPAACRVFLINYDRFTQIVQVDLLDYVDANGKPDADAAQILQPPTDIKKGFSVVDFVVEAKHDQAAQKKARAILKDGDGAAVFPLRADIKAARPVETDFPGSGGLYTPVKATGKTKLRLEFPRPVIWSNSKKLKLRKKDPRIQKIVVDTSLKDGEKFKVDLMQYNAPAKKYRPDKPPPEFDIKWEQADNPLIAVDQNKITISNRNAIKVEAQRLILGDKIKNNKLFVEQEIGKIEIRLKAPPTPKNGSAPINEPHTVSVFYKPINKAKAHIILLHKVCFVCGKACTRQLPDPQKEINQYKFNKCDCNNVIASVVEREITGENFTGLSFGGQTDSPEVLKAKKELFEAFWRLEFGDDKLNERAKQSGFYTTWKALD